MVYLNRYIASWVVLGIVIGIGLGAVVGYLTPIPGLTHLRTVTIVNSTTVTVPVTVTRTVASTATVSGRVETVTYTTTYTTTTTAIINHTTTVTLPPTTTTVNHTVTTTSMSTTTLPYTLTVTTTVIENVSQPPPLNLTDLNETITWMKTDYTLSMLGMVNLSLPLGYCEATIWVFPNASAAIVGVWMTPVRNVEQYFNSDNLLITFSTGIGEYISLMPAIVWVNPVNDFTYTIGFGEAWALGITNYPYPNYTVVVGEWFHHQSATWTYQYLNNGTYLMILAWPQQIPPGYPISLIQNPPGLCLVQVIRVKPGTPSNYILNMTFLGAQYWAWVRSIAQYGKPAPCYIPWSWTYGYALWHINITEPIGDNWAYYCSPSKGIWYPLKP